MDSSRSIVRCLLTVIGLALYVQGQNQGDVILRTLIGAFAENGRMAGGVEVYYNTTRYPICQTDTFSNKEADVICRQLGFSETVTYGTQSELIGPSTTFYQGFLYVTCSRGENRLDMCDLQTLNGDCAGTDNSGLAVICAGTFNSTIAQSPPSNGNLRLNTDGVTHPWAFSGRLEVYFQGQWGAVCNRGFDRADATTACNQLGFRFPFYFGTVGEFGFDQGNGPVWLDNLACTSADRRLQDCGTNPLGTQNCSDSQHVGLVCLGTGSLRLVGPPSSSSLRQFSGRLEVFVDREWGTVCGDGFGMNEANVACRQLGFSGATGYDNMVRTEDYDENPPILLDNVNCSSESNFLIGCSHRGVGVHDCTMSEVIELTCGAVANGLGVTLPLIAAALIVAVLLAP